MIGGVNMGTWNALAEGQPPRVYPAGQMIYLQGTHPEYFYYLISGTVRSFISTGSGEERVLTIHRAGDLMGEASFFDQCPRVSSAVAQTDCLVIAVDRTRLNDIFSRHPELAFPMLQHLARTVRLLSAHVDSATLPAPQRIARHLLSASIDDNSSVVCTHEGIGQAVGLSRVTVSRTLSSFVDRGWILPKYGAIEILDRDALDRVAY